MTREQYLLSATSSHQVKPLKSQEITEPLRSKASGMVLKTEDALDDSVTPGNQTVLLSSLQSGKSRDRIIVKNNNWTSLVVDPSQSVRHSKSKVFYQTIQ